MTYNPDFDFGAIYIYSLSSAYALLSMTQSVEQMDKLTAIPVEQVVAKLQLNVLENVHVKLKTAFALRTINLFAE